MNGDASLRVLVEKSIARDAESFRTLTTVLEPKVFGFIMARVGAREEALDAFQDVLVDLWQALATFRFEGEVPFYRFVFTIAKRRVIRSWKQKRDVPLDEVEEPEDSTFVAQAELTVVVQRALTKLGPPESDILALRHWSGYSFGEISSLLHMQETTVRVRHHRALEKLRSILRPYVTQ